MSYTHLLLLNAKQIIEQLLKSKKPELDWRISEYLCKDEIIHLLLSYISRLPSNINIKQIQKIYINYNDYGIEWINDTINNIINDDSLVFIENDRDFIICKERNNRNTLENIDNNNECNDDSKNSSSDDIDDLFEINPESTESNSYFDKTDIYYFEKLSYSLMKILCNSYAPKQVKSFLLRKIQFIIFHSMLVFHPLSNGNSYHSSEILNILLLYWPLQLFQILTSSNCLIIQYLFKYAIISRTYQWKFGEFIINLLCYNNNSGNIHLQQNINKYRKILIHEMLIKWNFLENIIKIATNPQIHGDEISNKYCLFITNLLKKCAIIKETINLFNSPNNMLCIIIDRFLNNLLNKKNNINKWHKINCAMTLKDIIKYLSKPTILTVINVPKSQGMIAPISSENNIYPLFEKSLETFGEYIPLIINEIICDVDNVDNDDNIKQKKKRLGLYKLNCIELLMLYIDIIKIKNENFKIKNINILCKSLLKMVFIYNENNIFLSKFRTFMNIINIYCIDQLKYMTIECEMVYKFMKYYNNNNNNNISHCALHAYIIQILWDIYDYHQQLKIIHDDEDEDEDNDNDDEWNFAQYIQSKNENTKQFIQMIEKQIELNEPQHDI